MRTATTMKYAAPIVLLIAISGCSFERRAEPPPAPPQAREVPAPEAKDGKGAKVSYYGDEFAGKKTASGERFNPKEYTAAHRSLPFGSRVRLTNPENGKQIEVRINDRGPFVKGREFDISEAAANALGLKKDGVAKLTHEVIERGNG